MSKSKSYLLIFTLLMMYPPSQTLGQDVVGVPDLFNSVATIAYTGPGVPSLLVVPDGNGNSFTAAHDEVGNVVDATITLFVRDSMNFGIANFPFEDLWLESADGGLSACIGGTTADSNTDLNGRTEWVHPLLAGGNSQAPVLVMINGSALITNPGLPLNFNSPDIDGNLSVNLSDIGVLASDYYSGYSFRCDLNGDGVLNLSDVPYFARHFGTMCP